MAATGSLSKTGDRSSASERWYLDIRYTILMIEYKDHVNQ